MKSVIFRDLKSGFSVAIGIVNILLAVLLIVACLVPNFWITWMLAFVYTIDEHPGKKSGESVRTRRFLLLT
jgi:hypothetical protein